METKEIICVTCPSGCHISVTADGGVIKSIEGNICERGKEYAEEEFLEPKRMLTTSVKAIGYKAPVIPVRTSERIPKRLIPECMEEIRKITIEEPFDMGRVVVNNILGTGVDVILTNN